MGIISYAQNFEDVLLNRVFGGVNYAFYVDVGAYHPVTDSVTKSFYDRGWDGINIEPGDVFDELAAARPRDVNLHMAVYDRAGTISFAQHPGWYAGLSHVQADPPAPSATASSVETRTVPCDTLANILEQHANGRPIAFLKIDAEGSEEHIVRSTDWRTIRPTVLLIEATKPRSTVLDNQRWEPILLEQGYRRAYFDGINCYYVPEERSDLLLHFDLPVNVLDGFQRFDPQLAAVRARSEAAEARIEELVAALARSSAQHDLSNEREKQQLEQNTALQRELQATQNKLEATRGQLESLPAAQNAAIAAVVEANAYQLADLRRQVAEAEAANASLIREHDIALAKLRCERDALLSVRDQAATLRRLLRELRWPEGPGALRVLLPLARLLRRLAGTKIPPVPPEELALLAPDAAGASTESPVIVAGAAAPPRRSLGKRALWVAYRPLRPVGRPAALRLRAFLTMHIHSEFMQLEQKLGHLREELARVPTWQPMPTASAPDSRITELQTEIRQFGKLLEDTLLTLAMESPRTKQDG